MSHTQFESFLKANIEPYRKQKASSWRFKDDMHFHLLSASSVARVACLLRTILRARVANQCTDLRVSCSESDYDEFLDFLAQLKFAYVHPRRASLRVDFFREFNVSANPTT